MNPNRVRASCKPKLVVLARWLRGKCASRDIRRLLFRWVYAALWKDEDEHREGDDRPPSMRVATYANLRKCHFHFAIPWHVTTTEVSQTDPMRGPLYNMRRMTPNGCPWGACKHKKCYTWNGRQHAGWMRIANEQLH